MVNFKREVSLSVEAAVKRVEEILKTEGFGILTRIDFDKKMKEKLNKDVPQLVILGACHPQMAFEAYQRNSDVTSLLPCNAVVRDIGNGKVSIELAKPSAMMTLLNDSELVEFAKDADQRLHRALEAL